MKCQMWITLSQTQVLLNLKLSFFVFEDNEAVIKKIIKGRSPTMRHVSRTHRLASDWVFDRVNLDPKIQVKYVDTKKKQLADMLIKGDFTRDEWSRFLRLLNFIMNFSLLSRSHFRSIEKASTMSKRAPGRRTEGEPVVAKSKQVSLEKKKVSLDSGASYSRVNQGLGRNSVLTSAERSVRDRVGNPTASSQEWKRDDLAFASAGRPVRGIHNRLARTKLAYHHPQIFDNLYHEKVCTNVRHKLNRSEDDKIFNQKMQCIDVGVIYVNNDESSSASWAKLQWEFDYLQEHQLRRAQDVVRHDDTSPLVQFFVWERCRIPQKPMRSGKISFNISNSPTTTKNYLESMEKLVSSSGIFSQDTTLQIPKRSKTKMAACQASPEETKDRIVFISMFNDIDLTKKWQSNECCSKSERDYAKKKRLQLGQLVMSRSRRRRKIVWNAQPQTWRKVECYCRRSW